MSNVGSALVAAGFSTTYLYVNGPRAIGTATLRPEHDWYASDKPQNSPEYLLRYGITADQNAPEAGGPVMPGPWAQAENSLRWGAACQAAAHGGWLSQYVNIPAGPLSAQDVEDLAYALGPAAAERLLSWYGQLSTGGASAGPLPQKHPVDPNALLNDYSGPWWLKLTGGLEPGGPRSVYKSVAQALQVFRDDLTARVAAPRYNQMEVSSSIGVMFPAQWIAAHIDQLIALGSDPIVAAPPAPAAILPPPLPLSPDHSLTKADLDSLVAALAAALRQPQEAV